MPCARLLLLTLLLCGTSNAPLLATSTDSPPAGVAEDAGEKRGPLLIKKHTVEVQAKRAKARTVGPVEGNIVKALLSGDGKKLAIFWEADQGLGEATGRMELWDVASNARIANCTGDFWPQGMAWRPQGDALAWVDWDREDIGDANGGITIRTGQLWLWKGGTEAPRHVVIPGRKVFSVAFTRDGRRVVAECGDVRVRVYNYASGKLERTVATTMNAAQYAAKMRSRR